MFICNSYLFFINSDGSSNNKSMGVVQLYYRGNYHWYLKQQWQSEGLICLGFDTETIGRLYMIQYNNHNNEKKNQKNSNDSNDKKANNKPNQGLCNAIRIIDITWDVCVSTTIDGTIAVTDGTNILLTPLVSNTVPPPMSLYKQSLLTPCKHSFFWPRCNAQGGEGEGVGVWGLACLCDGNNIRLIFSDLKGMPVRFVDVHVQPVLKAIFNPNNDNNDSRNDCGITLRGIAATEFQGEEEEEGKEVEKVVYVIVYGSIEISNSEEKLNRKDSQYYENSSFGSSSSNSGMGSGGSSVLPDQMLVLKVRVSDGVILSVEHSRNLHLTNRLQSNQYNNGINNMNNSYSRSNNDRISDVYNNKNDRNNNDTNDNTDFYDTVSISRISLWMNNPHSLAVGVIVGADVFDVYRVHISGRKGRKGGNISEGDRGTVLVGVHGDVMYTTRDGLDTSIGNDNTTNKINDHSINNSKVRNSKDNNSTMIDDIVVYPIVFPETCIQIAVIPKSNNNSSDNINNNNISSNSNNNESNNYNSNNYNNSNNSNDNNDSDCDLIIGLTARGKLYLGETLLVAGLYTYL